MGGWEETRGREDGEIGPRGRVGGRERKNEGGEGGQGRKDGKRETVGRKDGGKWEEVGGRKKRLEGFGGWENGREM